MRLAEALLRRKELEERLHDLRGWLAQSARVPEDERPAEEPARLLAEIEAVLAHLEALDVWIGKTCVLGTLPDGMSFAEARARMKTLRLKRQILLQAAEAAAGAGGCDRSTSGRHGPPLSAAALRREADSLLKECTRLEARIQEVSWQAELQD